MSLKYFFTFDGRVKRLPFIGASLVLFVLIGFLKVFGDLLNRVAPPLGTRFCADDESNALTFLCSVSVDDV